MKEMLVTQGRRFHHFAFHRSAGARRIRRARQSVRGVGEVISLVRDLEISLGDTAWEIARAGDVKIVTESDKEHVRPEKCEVERLWADTVHTQQLPDWKSQYDGLSGLARGSGEAIAWFREPCNLASYKSGIYNI
jgi:dTDP-glucose 4,6-dehydratase